MSVVKAWHHAYAASRSSGTKPTPRPVGLARACGQWPVLCHAGRAAGTPQLEGENRCADRQGSRPQRPGLWSNEAAMTQPADHPAIPALNVLRQRWQMQTATRRLTIGSCAVAAVGALFGLGLGSAASVTAGLVGAMLGAVLAVLMGLAATWLSTKPAETASPVAAVEMPRATSVEDPSVIRDALTGAYTQRYFIAAADREWSRIRRHGEDAAMLMIDVDHLRALNDQHGADCGDAVLVQVTRIVGATLRQYDLMARFNAGVLVVYLPHTDPIGAIDVAERIRDRVANFRMNWPTGSVAVTISVGVAAIGADHTALDAVIGDAGAALRAAKAAGRNCVRAGPVPPKRQPADGTRQGDHRSH